jgi:hypothetical protein
MLALVVDAEPGNPLAVSLVAIHEQPDGCGRIRHIVEGEGANPQPSRRQHVSSMRPERARVASFGILPAGSHRTGLTALERPDPPRSRALSWVPISVRGSAESRASARP